MSVTSARLNPPSASGAGAGDRTGGGGVEPTSPDIGVEYDERVPAEVVDEFVAAVRTEGVQLETRARPCDRVVAALEWAVPTAIVVYVLKSYLDGFLGEAGKRHFVALSGAFGRASERMRGSVSRVGPRGKPHDQPEFSLGISAVAVSDTGWTFKLLIQASLDEAQVQEAMLSFLEFLAVLHSAGEIDERLANEIGSIQHIGSTVFLAHDVEQGRLRVVDPMDHIRHRTRDQ